MHILHHHCTPHALDTLTTLTRNYTHTTHYRHMDLSFWAFERLAHPVYGVMGIEARPVNCYTKEPLRFLPGVYNKTLYGERPEAGT